MENVLTLQHIEWEKKTVISIS